MPVSVFFKVVGTLVAQMERVHLDIAVPNGYNPGGVLEDAVGVDDGMAAFTGIVVAFHPANLLFWALKKGHFFKYPFFVGNKVQTPAVIASRL